MTVTEVVLMLLIITVNAGLLLVSAQLREVRKLYSRCAIEKVKLFHFCLEMLRGDSSDMQTHYARTMRLSYILDVSVPELRKQLEREKEASE